MSKTRLSPENVTILANSCTNLRDLVLIHCFFKLRCTISEIISLVENNISFSHKTITLVHSRHSIRLSCPICRRKISSTFSFCPGCGNKVEKTDLEKLCIPQQRTINVDDTTLGLFKEFLERGGIEEKDGKRLIFDLTRHRVWQILKSSLDKLGIV